MTDEINIVLSRLDNLPKINIEIRDIEDNRQWYKKYIEFVPILMVNNEEVCHYFLDENKLMAAINA